MSCWKDLTRLPWNSEVDSNDHRTFSSASPEEWLCADAIARHATVYGETGWKTTLAAPVTQPLLSNKHVIVAQTSDDLVTLLRADDGKILAARPMPTATLVSLADSRLLLATTHGMVLVSNLSAASFSCQSEDHENVKNCSQQTLSMVKIPYDEININDMESITLLERDSQCYVAILVEGQLCVYQISQDHGGKDDSKAWLKPLWRDSQHGIHGVRAVGTSFWMGFVNQELVWWGLLDGTILGRHAIQKRVLDWNVLINAPPGVVAIVVVTKTAPQTVMASILQLQVQETFGVQTLIHPHVMYQIPVETVAARGATIAVMEAPWSFVLQLEQNFNNYLYKEFVPQLHTSTLANIHLLMEQGDFDMAEQEMLSIATSVWEDPCACFHPSQIPLKQLIRCLQFNHEANDDADDCLRRLGVGAVSKGGLEYLVAARDAVVQHATSTHQVEALLQRLHDIMSNVAQGLPLEQIEFLEAKRQSIARRLEALRFVHENDGCSEFSNAATIKSPASLMEALVSSRKFILAEKLYNKSRSQITTDVLVSSIILLDASVDPGSYEDFLARVVLPNIAINHELMPKIKSWACRIADELDRNDENAGLSRAIQLLKVFEEGLNKLRLSLHSSYAVYSPFVDRAPTHRSRRTPRNHASIDADASISDEILAKTFPRTFGPVGGTPVPTILDVGQLRLGASKTTVIRLLNSEEELQYEENEACIDDKLREALSLQEARRLGVPHVHSTLATFSKNGGSVNCARALVALHSGRSSSHEDRKMSMHNIVQPYCEKFSADFDLVILEHVKQMCKGKSIHQHQIQEAASLSQCCVTMNTQCLAILSVIRAAYLCAYSSTWLTDLSKKAIIWASNDSGLRSELEEAFRLLLIDGIVLKYCGHGARELFRVDNPRHAINLLYFVVKNVKIDTVLQDALSLCNAFTQLTVEDACRMLLCNAAISEDPCLAVKFLRQIFTSNEVVGSKSFSNMISFVEEILQEAAYPRRKDCTINKAFAQNGLASLIHCIDFYAEQSRIISLANYATAGCYLSNGSIDLLRKDLSRVQELQTRFNIFITLKDLLDDNVLLRKAHEYVVSQVAEYSSGFDLVTIRRMKRCCMLLCSASHDLSDEIWHMVGVQLCLDLIHRDQHCRAMDLLKEILPIQGNGGAFSCRSLIRVAFMLCISASASSHETVEKMKMLVSATSLLNDYACRSSPKCLLPSMLTLATLTDLATKAFTCADDGVGDSLEAYRDNLLANHIRHSSSIDHVFFGPSHLSVKVHNGWYVGDGLLLPATNTVHKLLKFCRSILGKSCHSMDAVTELLAFIRDRAAHSLSLRVLATSIALLQTHVQITCALESEIRVLFRDIAVNLVERSLGGTNAGILSAAVDSQLATALLLLLPPREAFNLYRSAIPTAIKKGSFDRVQKLANVGAVISSRESTRPSTILTLGWSSQDKFCEQCKSLSKRAMWALFLSKRGLRLDAVSFLDDPNAKLQYEGTDTVIACTDECTDASTLYQIFSHLSRKSPVGGDALRLCLMFASSVGLPKHVVFQKHVEFLLLMVPSLISDISLFADSIRRFANSSLEEINPALKRSAVLRKCVLALERDPRYATNYELHNVALSLYHDHLVNLLDHDPTMRLMDPAPFEFELELVDRRKDALAILSVSFSQTARSIRPALSSLFLPFEDKFGSTQSLRRIVTNILGLKDDEGFDPIAALEKLLKEESHGVSPATLSPLCLPLGVPNGYIHARHIMLKLQGASLGEHPFPSFENDVIPTISRLKSPSDVATFAEWCSSKYGGNDENKLRCLEIAEKAAVQTSSEVESRKVHAREESQKARYEELEAEALDSLKRISEVKQSTSDKVRIKAALEQAISVATPSVTPVIVKLKELFEETYAGKICVAAEDLVDFLLMKGSDIAAQASINAPKVLTMGDLRQYAQAVKEICLNVAENHSHIHVDRFVRRLARRWLFFGNTEATTNHDFLTGSELGKENHNTNVLPLIEEEDTGDFSISLSYLRDEEIPPNSHDVEHCCVISSNIDRPIWIASSTREKSESSDCLAALKIAFVLSLIDDRNDVSCNDTLQQENLNPQDKPPTSKRGGLLKCNDTLRVVSKHSIVSDHARELLQIVFAKSKGDMSLIVSANQSLSLDPVADIPYIPSTITFGMRYRALRAAATLCPQEVLEQVALEEGFLQGSNCTLSACSFGSFVAKEVEEMQLPIPHSSLVQLSTMNFGSFARSLWRHHRDSASLPFRGRLLILLLELACRDHNKDKDFIRNVLKEIERQDLPRTLFLASKLATCHELQHDVLDSNMLKKLMSVLMTDIPDDITDDANTLKLVTETARNILAMGFSCNNFVEDDELSKMLPEYLASSDLLRNIM